MHNKYQLKGDNPKLRTEESFEYGSITVNYGDVKLPHQLLKLKRQEKKNSNNYKSSFEFITAKALSNTNIEFICNTTSFSIYRNNNDSHYYTPDFITNVEKNKKPVFIETHGFGLFKNNKIFEKYKNFLLNYKDYVYFIIITNEDKIFIDKKLEELHYKMSDIADEIWFLPKNYTNEGLEQKLSLFFSNLKMTTEDDI